MGKTQQLLTFVAMLKRAHCQIVQFTSSCVTAFPWRLRAGAVPKEGERGSTAHVVRAVEGRVVFFVFSNCICLIFYFMHSQRESSLVGTVSCINLLHTSRMHRMHKA